MTNKKNFNGWSGNTEFTKLDITRLNLSGSTRSLSNMTTPIIEETVNVVKTPKNGPSRVKVSVPVYKTGETQTQTVTNTRSLSLPQELNSPFTAGTVDYSFPAGGGFSIDGFDGPVFDVKVDSNGKYLVGGDFGKYYYNGNQTYSPYLIRLNSDGTVDDTFNITFNSDCYGGGFDGSINSVEIQSDGKILVGGAFRTFDRDLNCNTSNRIIRLNSDGSKDLTFNIGDGFNDEVYDIQVQPNGKILVGGYFTQYNNIDAYHIIRLNSNGSIDSSFLIGNSDVSFNDYVNTIKLQSDGKILVGGYFTTYGFNSQNYISRLNTDGTIDLTFQIGNGFNDEVNTITLQSDGKIIVGGYFISFDNNDLFNGRIVRLDSNGTLDTLFGYGLDDTVQSISIQSDGKIIVGGYFTRYYINNNDRIGVNRLVRFHSDCSFDYSFYYDELFGDGIECITILEDNNILVGGYFGDGDPEIYPLNYFGRLHNSISVYPYSYTVLACAQPLVDERTTYVIGSMVPLEFESTHSFQSINNPSVTVCGYIDYTYPSNVIEYFEVVGYRDCGEAYIDNYKLVTVEDCIFPNGNQFFPVWIVDKKYEIGDILYIDLVLDGEGRFFNKFAATITSVDLDWNVPFPIWDYLPPINYAPYSSCDEAINANGVIYGANSCSEMETTYPLIHKAIYGPIALLIPTGTNPVKELFNYFPYGPYEYISNGTPEIYSTIEFNNCEEGLTKVSPEGILNENFANTGFDGSLVYTMVEQPDGKILIGGNFNQYLEVNVGNFMRINPDGTLDETFYLGQFDSYIRAIALQPDGKILVGGNFTNYDGYNAGRIIRLNSDGTIDRNFTYSSEFNDIVRAIAIQRDGKIVVGGDFNYYYDFYCPQIVRLNSDGTPDTTFVMGDGFDGDQVFTINIESTIDRPYYFTQAPITYTENIIVGGWFNWYNGTTVRGIVKLSPTGEVLPDFGEGFNADTGGRPRVNQIVTQPDGKLIIIGGADGGQLLDYNTTWIPQNIVRLEKDRYGIYQIDQTFTTRVFDDTGGFNNGVISATVLPNGKIMVGGQFNYYGDNQNIHVDIPYLVRLNSNGTLDETFTFTLDDDYVNKVLLLSSGRLLVGGRFNSPYDRLLELFIGDEYKLHSFDTCEGLNSNVFLPTNSNLTEPVTVKGNINNIPSVCGNLGDIITTPQTLGGNVGGSMYFNGNTNTIVQVDNGGGQFGFNGGNDFTIEWFQYWQDGSNSRPFSIGVYSDPNEMIGMSFEGSVYIWVNNSNYNTNINNSDILDGWHHIAITRNFNGGDRVWRVFLDGIQKTSFIDNTDTSNTYTLTLGNQLNNDGLFRGYITNFRVNNLTALYTSDFTVPTSPLTCEANIILLMNSTDEANLLKDSCGGQSITTTGVTWSTESPFVNTNSLSLFNITDNTVYETCQDCGEVYNTILYVRNGTKTNRVQYGTMTKTNIDKVLSLGPIFTIRGPECFEILKYYK